MAMRLCGIHKVGASLGQAIPYDPLCPTCVRVRGHLPEGQRDRPGVTHAELCRVGGAAFHVPIKRNTAR